MHAPWALPLHIPVVFILFETHWRYFAARDTVRGMPVDMSVRDAQSTFMPDGTRLACRGSLGPTMEHAGVLSKYVADLVTLSPRG